MAETEPAKISPRPIIRIGVFLMSHNALVSVLCCAAGVLALMFLPVLAKNTYISENALMPGSASPMLSSDDVSGASKFVNKILNLKSFSSGIVIRELIIEHIIALGGEANYHKFQPEVNNFHPLGFFASHDPQVMQENFSCSSYGVNTVGIIRAPHGDGKEAIVLVTPYNSLKITAGEALSLGIAYSVFSLLSRVTWLARDIIWVAADSQHGEYGAVAAWLRDYHTPVCGGLWKMDSQFCHEGSPELETDRATETEICDTFRRAGTIAAALVIKVADRSPEFDKDGLKIYAEASNGQMPNLDLINIVNYLAVHGQGLLVKVEKVQSLSDSWWLGGLGKLFESVGKVARSLNLQWNIDISVKEYVEGSAVLASSLYNQALGIPTGSHGAFRDYQVDAITMEILSLLSTSYKGQQNEFLRRGGRLVEGIIRSVNNLLEKFHQSFFLYLLTSPNKFVSVGVYMIAFGLLVVPLPLVAASLFSDASERDSSMKKDKSISGSVDGSAIKYGSWKWVGAAKNVFIVHLWGALMTLFPYFHCHIPKSSSLASLMIWSMFSVISLLFLRLILGSSFSFAGKGQTHRTQCAYLKSVTIATAFIGLCLMSVINFATAEIGALLLVPMCLMAVPLRLKAKTLKTFVQAACNLSVIFLGFLPVAFWVLKSALEGFDQIQIGEFWNWMEALWKWSSATYVYICMVHLPCWVLCILILLHPC